MSELLLQIPQFLAKFIVALGPAVVVLGFLIFIHELGHFIAARLVGIRVEVFSIGFGKRLFGIRRGATDYRVSLIPLGGYVRMAGEEMPGQEEGGGDASEMEKISAQYAEPGDTLNEKPVPHRLLVAVAGAAMNAVTAVILTIGLAYFGINIDAYLLQAPIIGYIQMDSAAETAGLQANDLITRIGDKTVSTWEEAQQEFLVNHGSPTEVTVDRNGSTQDVTLEIPKDELTLFGGIGPATRVSIAKVNKGSPAERAGLKPNDIISEINGLKLAHYLQLLDVISHSEGKEISLTLLRNDEKLSIQLTPEFNEEANRYLIGINFGSDPEKVLRRYPVREAITKGVELNVQMGYLMISVFKNLVMGRVSLNNLGGPVMIADMARESAKSGVRDLIWLTAIISLNLAILNLLPLPILDGGMIVFLFIEAIIRRPVSEKVQLILQNLFFILFIALAIYISFLDITRTDFTNWFR